MVLRGRGSAALKLLAVAAALLLSLAAATRAEAYKALATHVLPQANSPVRIIDCAAQLGRGVSVLDWSSERGLEDFSLNEHVSFENVAARLVQTVDLRFAGFDVFGGALDAISVSASGKFSPGVLIRLGPLAQFNPHGQELDAIECSIARVMFADGSSWSAAPAPAGGPNAEVKTRP